MKLFWIIFYKKAAAGGRKAFGLHTAPDLLFWKPLMGIHTAMSDGSKYGLHCASPKQASCICSQSVSVTTMFPINHWQTHRTVIKEKVFLLRLPSPIYWIFFSLWNKSNWCKYCYFVLKQKTFSSLQPTLNLVWLSRSNAPTPPGLIWS